MTRSPLPGLQYEIIILEAEIVVFAENLLYNLKKNANKSSYLLYIAHCKSPVNE